MDALPEFELVRATTLDDVIKARASHPGGRLLGGGSRPDAGHSVRVYSAHQKTILAWREISVVDAALNRGSAPVCVGSFQLGLIAQRLATGESQADEFDLDGAPLFFHFTRDKNSRLTGFVLNGFSERGIVFTRLSEAK